MALKEQQRLTMQILSSNVVDTPYIQKHDVVVHRTS